MLRSLWAAFRRASCAAAICGGVFASCLSVGARADYVINEFNSAAEASAWYWETWSSAPATAEWDPTVDSLGDPNSGSLKIVIDFDAAEVDGKNAANFSRTFATPLDATPATLMIADIMVSPDSPNTPWGDQGYMQLVARTGDNWDWTAQFQGNLDSDGNWVPLDINPVDPVTDIRALTFQLWGGPGQNLHGQTTLWLDNLRFLGDFPVTNTPGDTDGDHDVDLDDLNNVRNNFGGLGQGVAGDTDADGDVDLDDLNAVRNNFGSVGSNSVPEPAAGMLALAGIAAIGILRRRAR